MNNYAISPKEDEMKITKRFSRFFAVVGVLMLFANSGFAACTGTNTGSWTTSTTTYSKKNQTVQSDAADYYDITVVSAGTLNLTINNEDSNEDLTVTLYSDGTCGSSIWTQSVTNGNSVTHSENVIAGTYTVRLVGSRSDRNTDYDFSGSFSAPAPEINVQGNSNTINDGDNSPSTTDHTDFGSTNIGSTVDRTYTIQNNGAATLTIVNPTVTGDFTLLTPPSTLSIVAGGSTTFTVRFVPTAAGTRNGTISFPNNDSSENPYNFSISGTGVDPILTCPGRVIPNLDGASVTSNQVFSGTIPSNETYYYHFTPTVAGTIQVDSSMPNSGSNSLFILNGCGGTVLWSGTNNSNNKSTSEVNVAAGQTIVIQYDSRSSNNRSYNLDFTFTVLIATANADNFSTAYNTVLSGNVMSNDKGSGIQVVTSSTSTPAHGTVIMQSDGTFTYTPTTGYSGTDNFTYTIQDSSNHTSTATVTITVGAPNVADAVDDTFGTLLDVAISGNVLGNDSGDGISVSSNTVASNGSVIVNADGSFNYIPTIGFYGTDTFTYTITDSYGNTDTATVTITVSNDTDFKEGLQDFVLINPPSTRNIIGNYAIAGNTIECITNKRGTSTETDSYDGTCQDGNGYNDNNYMAKYLDIDGDTGIGITTWNSSSSNFTLPDTQSGILWAGLFWQGSINNEDGNYKQRRAYVDGSSYSFKNITTDEDIDLEATNGNKLLLRIDSDTSYTPIQATTFYYDTAHGDEGGYYAAYSDVTQFIKNKNLADGMHTATVANITANEGRQEGTGNYAGWTLVVIYAESGGGSKARNISVYNGYTVISSSSGTRSVKISGFKLPSANTVTSQFSSFAGEGEHVYTPDRMFISKFSDLSSPQNMPGATDANNIFDAILANIDRDSGNDNDVVNANGIDIDSYDVSDIMTAYRDADENIDTVYIGLNSGQDYITPSMMAFATELYRPSVCYDYTVQKNDYDITSEDRVVRTSGIGKLSVTLALQSLEGDFDFMNSQIGIRMVPTTNTQFDEAFFAPNNANTLIPAIHTAGSTPAAPMIAIGENITPIGGTIRRNQRYFTGFNYTLLGNYDGKFEVDLNTTLDFGSGLVPSWQSSQYDDIPRCPQSDYYNPLEGAFNVERTNSEMYNPITQPTSRFPLYTQIVGKDFDIDVVAYNQSSTPAYSTELVLSGYTVDLELIDASPFSDDRSVFVCNNPSPFIIKKLNSSGNNNIFVKFPTSSSSSRVDLSLLDIQTDTALKNAAFRLWYIIDSNNTILPHQCTGPEDETCFENLYEDRIKADDKTVQADGTVGLCQEGCGTGTYSNPETGKSGCYACLRDFFAKAVCSRDNFSIRPASYRVKISDNNESTDTASTTIELGINDSNNSVATLAAGYQYKLDGIATSNVSDTDRAFGYTREFTIPSNSDLQSTLLYNTDTTKNPVNCVDKNNTDWKIEFDNGNMVSAGIVANNLVSHSNVGQYHYHIEDANWTLVDQSRYAFKTFAGVDDCIANSNLIGTSTTQSGCITNTELNGYTDLHLTYKPYKFDLSAVSYTKNPTNTSNYTYMNDFNNSYYNDLVLRPFYATSISFEGNVSALSKDDVLLTNFTNGCAASNINFAIERTTFPVAESGLVDISNTPVLFQQYLQHTNKFTNPVDKVLGIDQNVTLPPVAFSDANAQGKAAMFLYTTFKKPLNSPVNPFNVNYEMLEAKGDVNTNSSAHMTTHIPEGNNTYDQNTTFIFAKVTPLQKLYEDVSVNFKNTPIFVDVYCSFGADCNTSYGLSVPTKGLDEVSDWYYANMFNNTNEGTTNLVAETDTGANASPIVTPSSDISFISDIATRNDIVVSLTGSGRPTTVGVDIVPVPWLRYDPIDINGYPHYQIEFIDSGWSGVGTTGHVGDTKSSTESSPRMNW